MAVHNDDSYWPMLRSSMCIVWQGEGHKVSYIPQQTGCKILIRQNEHRHSMHDGDVILHKNRNASIARAEKGLLF